MKIPIQVDRRDFLTTTATIGFAGTVFSGATEQTQTPRTTTKVGPMKITALKTYVFNVPTGNPSRQDTSRKSSSSRFKTWLFLKIETNTELSGWGEGSIEWLSPVVETTLHGWKELLLGQDPLNVVALCDDISDRLPWKGGPVLGSALAAVNMALYDIAGKAWGVPVSQILGGRKRNQIRVYHGSISFESATEARAQARASVAAGVRGLKGNPLETRTWPMDHVALKECTGIVEAVRNEVGPDVELMLDTHGSPNPALSIAFAKSVAPYRPLFLEEPCKVGSVAALREISEHSPVPIATGEKLFSFREFKEIIDARACSFLQPDMSHSFGINQFLAISRLAEEAQILMAPHNASGPVHLAALCQADAVIGNFLIQEAWGLERIDQYVEHDLSLVDGHIELSNRPGLGIEVKETDIAKLPHDDAMSYRQYRHADNSWKGW